MFIIARWAKKLKHLVALKLKSRSFIRDNFLNDVDIEKLLLSNNCLPVKKVNNLLVIKTLIN